MAQADEAQDDQTEWELLGEFARRRDELDPFLLRGLLANTLRSRGFASIVWSEDGAEGDAPVSRAPTIVTLIVIWSLGVSATTALGLPWLLTPLGMLGVAVAFATLAKLTRESAGLGGLCCWVGSALVLSRPSKEHS